MLCCDRRGIHLLPSWIAARSGHPDQTALLVSIHAPGRGATDLDPQRIFIAIEGINLREMLLDHRPCQVGNLLLGFHVLHLGYDYLWVWI